MVKDSGSEGLNLKKQKKNLENLRLIQQELPKLLT